MLGSFELTCGKGSNEWSGPPPVCYGKLASPRLVLRKAKVLSFFFETKKSVKCNATSEYLWLCECFRLFSDKITVKLYAPHKLGNC